MSRFWCYTIAACLFITLGSALVFEANTGFFFFSAIVVFLAWVDYLLVAKARLELTGLHIIFACLLISVAISSIISGDGHLSLMYAVQYSICFCALLVFSQKNHPVDRATWLKVFTNVMAWMICLLILERVGLRPFSDVSLMTPAKRLGMTFGNPNYLAAVLILLFPLFLNHSLGAQRRKIGTDWVCPTFAGITFLMILATGSRNALLWCVLASCLIIFRVYFYEKRSVWTLKHTCALGAVPIGLYVWFMSGAGRAQLEKFSMLLQGGGVSDLGRLAVWQMVLDNWSDSTLSIFLGKGWGALYPLSMQSAAHAPDFRLDMLGFKYAHSEVLEWLLEGGVVAVVLLFTALSITIWYLLRTYLSSKQASELDDSNWQFGLLVSILGICGFSLFSVATRYMVVLMPLMICLGLALRELKHKPILSIQPKLLVGLGICVLISGGVVYSARVFYSDYLLKYASVYADSSEDKRNVFMAAIDSCPEHVSARYQAFIYFTTLGVSEDLALIDKQFTELEERIAGFKNTKALYAYYLGDQGDFSGAADLLVSAGDDQRYRLSYLADALFYLYVQGDIERFNLTADDILQRALEAEDIDFKDVEYAEGALANTIPQSVRMNQPILKYYVFAEVVRMIWSVDPKLQSPRFLSVLSGGDQDKVLRLAHKLEEISSNN